MKEPVGLWALAGAEPGVGRHCVSVPVGASEAVAGALSRVGSVGPGMGSDPLVSGLLGCEGGPAEEGMESGGVVCFGVPGDV